MRFCLRIEACYTVVWCLCGLFLVCLSLCRGSHHSNDSESNSPPAGQTGVPTQVVQQVQTAQVMHTHMYRWDIKAIQIKLNPKLWFVSSRGPWFRPQPRVKVDNWGSVICTSHLRYTHFITMILLHTCHVYVRSHLLYWVLLQFCSIYQFKPQKLGLIFRNEASNDFYTVHF